MACRFTYKGKVYTQDALVDALREMTPSEAAPFIPGVTSVPDAPFVGSTAAWSGLALRRMIRWAAENGFDQVAWTPGDVQNERYDLSKQIDSVDVERLPNGNFLTTMTGKRGEARGGGEPTAEQLPDWVGKDFAQKIVDDLKKPGDKKLYRGIDLKVGGSGMRGFYDKMLVTTANKLGKKFGAKVGQIQIFKGIRAVEQMAFQMDMDVEDAELINELAGGSTEENDELVGEEAITVHSLPITPEMRRAVMEGQPLFKNKSGKVPPTAFVASQKQVAAANDEAQALALRILGHRVSVSVTARPPRGTPSDFMAVYRPAERSIWLSMAAAHDMSFTIGHEGMHYLSHSGAILANEWKALVALAKRQGYGNLDPATMEIYQREYQDAYNMTDAEFAELMEEEAVADMFGAYVDGRETGNKFVDALMARLQEFIDALLNYMRGQGFNTPYRTLREGYQGKLAERIDQQAEGAAEEGMAMGSAGDWLKRHISYDNPAHRGEAFGAEWLARKIEAAEAKMGPGKGLSQKGITGATTAWTKQDVMVPVSMLRRVDGVNDEVRIKGESQYDRLMEAVEREGWKGDESPIAVAINHKGIPYITEGNTRVAVAATKGITHIPATIYWLNGAENVPGQWTPEALAERLDDPRNPAALGMVAPPDGSGSGTVPPSAVADDPEVQEDLDKYAGNINLYRLNTSEDIKDMLRQIATDAEGFMGERRGVISHEQTIAMAQELGLTEAQLLARQTGEAWNNAYIFAARTLMLKSANRVMRTAATAARSQSQGDMGQALRAIQRHIAIQEKVSGLAAEAGRALDQFNIIAKKDYEGALDAILSGVRNRNSSFAGRAGGDEGMARELVDMLSRLNDPSEVSRFIAEANRATKWDMVREFWIAGLLSGPQTIIVNLLGNLGVALWQVPVTGVAAAIGAVRGGPDRVRAAEVMARLSGLVAGAWEGAWLAGHYFMTGDAPDPVTRLDNQNRAAIPGMAGYIIRTPLRAMEGGDQFFKEINKRAELHALAVRTALGEQRRGADYNARVAFLIANPTRQMMAKARDAALYGSFQRKMGPIGNAIMAARETIPGAWWVVPFIKTGVNLVKYAMEHSPVAPVALILPDALKSVIKDNLKGRNGKAAQDTQIAKIVMGTGLVAGVVAMVAAGILTGGAPDDPEEREVWQKDHQAYSVYIGGTWYSYQRLDPFAMIIGVTVDFINTATDATDKGLEDAAALILYSMMNVMQEKTWFKGPVDFLDAFFGRTSSPETMKRYVRGIPATFAVPNIINQTAKWNDPVLRETKSLTDQIRSRLPVVSQSLLPSRNIFGEPRTREGSLGPDILSPIWITTDKNNRLADEMLRLEYFPGKPKDVINGHKLTPEQYDRYLEVSGTLAKEAMGKKISQDSWETLDPDRQIKKIKDIFDDAREKARLQLKRTWPELRTKPKD